LLVDNETDGAHRELSIMEVNPCLPCDKPCSAATW